MPQLTPAPIVVAGSGLAASAAVLGLSHTGHRVRWLCTASAPAWPSAAADPQRIALSRTSLDFLGCLGLDVRQLPGSHDIAQVHVSEAGCAAPLRLRGAADAGLGCIVALGTLQSALWRAIAQMPEVQQDAMPLQGVSARADGVRIWPRSGPSFTAPLLLLAEARDPAVLAGLRIQQRPLGRPVEIVSALIQLAQPHVGCAFERFVPPGVIGVLPTGARSCQAIGSVPQGRVSDAGQWWQQGLEALLTPRFASFTRTTALQRTLLQPQAATQLQRGRCLLLGNVARLLHPAAGQGFNLVLRDIARIMDAVSEPTERDWPERLLRCAEQRQRDHQSTQRLIDAVLLNARGVPGAARLRSIGRFALERNSLLKNRVRERFTGRDRAVCMPARW